MASVAVDVIPKTLAAFAGACRGNVWLHTPVRPALHEAVAGHCFRAIVSVGGGASCQHTCMSRSTA